MLLLFGRTSRTPVARLLVDRWRLRQNYRRTQRALGRLIAAVIAAHAWRYL
jgi:hypothetical protein